MTLRDDISDWLKPITHADIPLYTRYLYTPAVCLRQIQLS